MAGRQSEQVALTKRFLRNCTKLCGFADRSGRRNAGGGRGGGLAERQERRRVLQASAGRVRLALDDYKGLTERRIADLGDIVRCMAEVSRCCASDDELKRWILDNKIPIDIGLHHRAAWIALAVAF